MGQRIPEAYLLTSTTYGSWLHGDERGSVDDERNEFATMRIMRFPLLKTVRGNALVQPPMYFNTKMIRVVDSAIKEVCAFREWLLHALSVRTNHIHAVVFGAVEPERILGDFKRYATRALRRDSLVGPSRRVWTEGGSTRYLWKKESVTRAMNYVLREQGPDLREPRTF